ncbi:MAG TPA: cytochrome c3 family protein [Methylomirabilota bacterium]|nr:cytochrome c3 family protein [Methylomirabilota bacterium]
MKPTTPCAIILGLALVAPGGVPASEPTSCVACHGNPDVFDGELLELVERWRSGVHAAVELGCHDCHGGNPDPALAENPAAAMDRDYPDNPYLGTPQAAMVPSFCGRCHSDPEFMKRFNPAARVDQEREYWTSQHGQALRRGDPRVATCVDCHRAHGVLRAGNTQSPVYPKAVAETCGRCHSDPQRMAGSSLPDGRPLPVDQQARWRRSVHARAMFEKDDLSAPTCNDCHGNHGATPPGVDSINFVCGQCHGREAALFRSSPKQDGFQNHNVLLSEAGDESCAGCHEPPDPAAGLVEAHKFSECVTCHGNHAVVRPGVAMLEPLPATPCAFCHEPVGELAEAVPEPEKARENFERVRGELLQETSALSEEERFNELVRRALELDFHTEASRTEDAGGRVLRAEFERLFTKFRISTTTFTFPDPVTGDTVSERVVRCGDCHAAEPVFAEEPAGLRVASTIVTRMRELTVLTARAERIVLAARRGGVEIRDALGEIDQAVDAQIELEVLVHAFAPWEGSEFAETHSAGVEHAHAALLVGQEGLEQLRFRRRGLALSLVFIVLVLIGIALKIRQLPAR